MNNSTQNDITRVAVAYVKYVGKITPASAQEINEACNDFPSGQIIRAFQKAGPRGMNWKLIDKELIRLDKTEGADKYRTGNYQASVISDGASMLAVWQSRKPGSLL